MPHSEPTALQQTVCKCHWTLNTIYSAGGLPYWVIQRYEGLSAHPGSVLKFNSLWYNDTIWWHISGSTLVQVMACCPTAPESQYSNQYRLLLGLVAFTLEQIYYYNGVKISVMASHINSLTILYSTIYSRHRSMKTSKLCVTGLCEGNSSVTGQFSAQRARNAENVSIWWRYHERVRKPWFHMKCFKTLF